MLPSETRTADFLRRLKAHESLIRKVCYVYGTDAEDRKDLFQEITIRLWKAWPTFRGEASLATWVYRIALNTAISLFRQNKNKPHRQAQSDDGLDAVAEPPTGDDRLPLLYEAIATLTDVEKAVVMLYLDDYSYDEMAAITGMTANHLRVKMNRIKNQLRHRLNSILHGT